MRVALVGYGKMGKTIESVLLREGSGHEVVARINEGEIDSLKDSGADVAIEFSRPEAAVENLLACFEAGIPVVSGTTGWLEEMDKVKEAMTSSGGAFFYAPNFSIGVNVFFALNKWLAERMSNLSSYSASMEEIHHTEKLDSPSGTAIHLAEGLILKHKEYREWVEGNADSSDVLEITSKREPNVPGTHSISYSSNVDCIKIEHEAKSRLGFAEGAVQAAEFLIGKKGFYTMEDLLQLK